MSLLTPRARVQFALKNDFYDWRNSAKCIGDLMVMVRPCMLECGRIAFVMHCL